MSNIIHGEEYRVDVLIDDRVIASHQFTAADTAVTSTARHIVITEGGDHGDVYQHDGTGRATYYETVGVE